MVKAAFCKFLSLVLVFSTVSVGMAQTASAAVVGTRVVMAESHRADTVERVQAALDRADIQAQFAALGVDSEAAKARVAALSDEELRYLDGQLAEMPAGSSLLAVIGIVFVVLLILELVGVINIFNKV
jgi:Skp family chaperone for outer membrane proteins